MALFLKKLTNWETQQILQGPQSYFESRGGGAENTFSQ